MSRREKSQQEALDPNSYQLRPLAEYALRLPSSHPGKRLNRGTLWRWAQKGVRGVVLKTRRLGGGRYTCDAWVLEFMEEPSDRERVVAAADVSSPDLGAHPGQVR